MLARLFQIENKKIAKNLSNFAIIFTKIVESVIIR